MEGVPAGRRTIRQDALRPDFMMGGDTEVDVPPAGGVDVRLDLTTYRIVPVKLQIELDGEPVPGVEVRLVDETFWPRRRIPDLTERYEACVGKTDAEGRLSAYGRAPGRRIPVLLIDGWSLQRLAPGSYDVVAFLFDEPIAPGRLAEAPDDVYGAASESRRDYAGEVELVAGSRAQVRLTPR